MANKYDRSLSNSTLLQLLQDVVAPVHQARLEALLGAGVAPLAEVGVKVNSDHPDALTHHTVALKPVSGPAVAVTFSTENKNKTG